MNSTQVGQHNREPLEEEEHWKNRKRKDKLCHRSFAGPQFSDCGPLEARPYSCMHMSSSFPSNLCAPVIRFFTEASGQEENLLMPWIGLCGSYSRETTLVSWISNLQNWIIKFCYLSCAKRKLIHCLSVKSRHFGIQCCRLMKVLLNMKFCCL